jgi:hypothetical protein
MILGPRPGLDHALAGVVAEVEEDIAAVDMPAPGIAGPQQEAQLRSASVTGV